MMDVRKNPRYSEVGKEELMKGLREEFAKKIKTGQKHLEKSFRTFVISIV